MKGAPTPPRCDVHVAFPASSSLLLATLALLVVTASGCASTARGADVPDVREPIDASAADGIAHDATVDTPADCGELGCDDIGPWVHRFGGEGPGGTLQSATDRDGNIYVAGSASFASYRSDSARRWSRYIPNATFLDLAIGRDGNVYASGYFENTVDFGGGPLTVSSYRRDPFVASFTSAGAYRWAHAFGETGRAVSARVAVDEAGNVFVAGFFAATLDFGGGPVESVGFDYNVYVASYGAGGEYRWSRRFDRGGLAGGPAVRTDANGNVYLVGGYMGSIVFDGMTVGAGAASGSFIASLTNSGTTRWAHDLGEIRTTDFVVARDGTSSIVEGTTLIRYTSDGSMRDTRELTAYAGLPALDDVANLYLVSGGNLVSFTAAGELRWMRAYPATSTPSGYATLSDLTADGAGNVYLTSTFVDRADFGSGELTGNGYALVGFASDGTPRWSRRFGSGWDRAHSVAVHDDDVYLAGTFTDRTDFGTGELRTHDDGEMYLASFTRAGTPRWSHQFGGVSNFRNRHQVAVDREGNVYLAGAFAATVDFGGGPITSTIDPLFTGEDDVYLASFTRDGAHRWSRRIGFTYHARSVGLAIGPRGELYVAFGGTLERYAPTDGSQVWSHAFMGVRSDRGAPRLATDDAGNVYFTGVAFGTLDLGGEPLMSAGDVFVASFTSDGVHRWSSLVGESNEDLGSNITVDANGDVYVAAYFRGVPQFGGPPIPPAATVLRSYSRDGVQQWTHRFAGVGGANDGPAVAPDPRGGVYLTGQYQGAVDFGAGATSAPEFSDAFVADFDAAGALRNVRTFPGSRASSAANGVAVDARGAIYVTGSFSGAVDFGVGRLESESYRETFLARLLP
jgi:hypothetical protein